jgi:hypothetical protein
MTTVSTLFTIEAEEKKRRETSERIHRAGQIKNKINIMITRK